MGSYQAEFSDEATAFVEGQSKKTQRVLMSKVALLELDPYRPGTMKLQCDRTYRTFEVSDYGIIYRVVGTAVLVEVIHDLKDVYRRFERKKKSGATAPISS